MRRQSIGLLAVLVTGVTVGIGPAPTHAAEGDSVTGTVQFSGTPPARPPVNFGAEQQCALMHADKTPLMEDIVVNDNGTLRDVLVYVTGEVPGTHTAPSEPLVFEQKGCVFLPHVGAMMVGQPVEIRNDDAVLHNVRAQSKLGQSFNVAQPVKGMKTTKQMKTQEIGIPLKCDVHFWMTGYLHVLAHPFFAVTGEDGSFTIPGLPAGTYTLEAWHGVLGTQTAEITVGAGSSQSLSLTFGGS